MEKEQAKTLEGCRKCYDCKASVEGTAMFCDDCKDKPRESSSTCMVNIYESV